MTGTISYPALEVLTSVEMSSSSSIPTSIWSDIDLNDGPTDGEVLYPKNSETDLKKFFLSMKKEQERLNTFLMGDWPLTFVKPADLAKAGFFYLQNGDRVQCAFCKGVICRWEPEDMPMAEHIRHYERCPFILGYDVGNVPIKEDPVRDSKLKTSGKDVCGGFHGERHQKQKIKFVIEVEICVRVAE